MRIYYLINKKIKNCRLLLLAVAIFIFFLNIQTSFAKEYYYQDFEVDIKINQDSTFDVTEKQIYYLDGSFGFINRDISLQKIDAITDIEVFDENNKLISKSELDIKSISGAKHVQWDFPRRDFNQEEKSWTIKYKVHGGISFLKDYDEIYWNAIPYVRDVAIKNVRVTVSLENGKAFNNELIKLYAKDIKNPALQTPPNLLLLKGRNDKYENKLPIGGYYFDEDYTEAIFWGKNAKPNTNFTVAVGFPKGIVSQSAYFKDFFIIYYGYIFSFIIIITSFLYGFFHWYKTEKSREGKRAIIPQYEPPQNLRPAMAEVIVKEKLTDKGLAATIIDLAVRGYVKIEEEEPGFETKVENFFKLITYFLIPFFLIGIIPFSIKIVILNPIYDYYFSLITFYLWIIIIIIIMISKTSKYKFLQISKNRDYKVIESKSYENDTNLEDYEKEYLKVLFSSKDYFSTKEVKKSPSKSRKLYEKILKVKDKIYEETELDTKAYEIGLTEEKDKKGVLFFIFISVIFIGFSIGDIGIIIKQFYFLIATLFLSIIFLYAFIKYEARLSDEGIKLKEDWLGFKMYLKTAERYRIQNLKPEYFEKYLPYAMIFGVEKNGQKRLNQCICHRRHGMSARLMQ